MSDDKKERRKTIMDAIFFKTLQEHLDALRERPQNNSKFFFELHLDTILKLLRHNEILILESYEYNNITYNFIRSHTDEIQVLLPPESNLLDIFLNGNSHNNTIRKVFGYFKENEQFDIIVTDIDTLMKSFNLTQRFNEISDFKKSFFLLAPSPGRTILYAYYSSLSQKKLYAYFDG